MLKKLFSIVFTAYAILVFAGFLPFIILFYLAISRMEEKRRLTWYYRAHYLWIRSWEMLTFIHFRVNGIEKLSPDKAYVIISNHVNLLDILMMGSRLKHPFKSLVKTTFIKFPVMGWIFRRITIAVDRSSKLSRARSFSRMIKTLQNGTSILIFPEGTRNRTEEPLKAFYDGAFRLAIKAQKPIAPVILYNHAGLQPVNTLLFFPGKGGLKVLDPIPTEGLGEEDLQTFKERVYAIMEREIRILDRRFNAQEENSFAQPYQG